MLFDLNFPIHAYFFRDLRDPHFSMCALDVLQNCLADKDIDVFEHLYHSGLLDIFQDAKITADLSKLLIQVCCCIV